MAEGRRHLTQSRKFAGLNRPLLRTPKAFFGRGALGHFKLQLGVGRIEVRRALLHALFKHLICALLFFHSLARPVAALQDDCGGKNGEQN